MFGTTKPDRPEQPDTPANKPLTQSFNGTYYADTQNATLVVYGLTADTGTLSADSLSKDIRGELTFNVDGTSGTFTVSGTVSPTFNGTFNGTVDIPFQYTTKRTSGTDRNLIQLSQITFDGTKLNTFMGTSVPNMFGTTQPDRPDRPDEPKKRKTQESGGNGAVALAAIVLAVVAFSQLEKF
jgi:hypothetical protein